MCGLINTWGTYMKKIISICFILTSICCAGLCGVATAGEITDMIGRQVMVPDTIQKVYGASPPSTCMVYAVDPDLIAGLNYPPRDEEQLYMLPRVRRLPVVGGWFGQGQTPNLETLLKVAPDIVLLWQWQQSATNEKIEDTVVSLGFPVVYLQIDTLGDYPKAFEFLGKLLHREQRATALAAYARETLKDMQNLKSGLSDAEKISVYYAEGANGLSTDCSASIHAELIPLCGGKNVHVCESRDVYGMEQVSAEQVVLYNPQVILARESAFYGMVYTDARWQNIRAVREHNVFKIPRSPFDWFDRPPSFMRLLGARWLMNGLYPDKYPVDMIKETQNFYHLFLNTDLDGKAAAKILGL